MRFYDFIQFMQFYDDWNVTIKINDNNLDTIIKCKITDLMCGNGKYYNYKNVFDMEVVSFGFYDGELCVRVKE